MREQITAEAQARLVIGGKLDGFAGYHPGIFEEAWLSLTKNMEGAPGEKKGPAGQPLFLAGAFGGAARAVIDVLEGRDRVEFTDADARSKVSHYDLAEPRFKADGETFVTRDAMRRDLRNATQNGLAAALNNGLDDSQNRMLFGAADPARIAELVITGLTASVSSSVINGCQSIACPIRQAPGLPQFVGGPGDRDRSSTSTSAFHFRTEPRA